MIEHMLTYWYIYLYPIASFVVCLAIIIYERIDSYRGKDIPYKLKVLFQKCKTCNGEGEVPEDYGLESIREGYIHYRYIPCPDCQEVHHLEQRLPCRTCYEVGELEDGSVCPDCSKSGTYYSVVDKFDERHYRPPHEPTPVKFKLPCPTCYGTGEIHDGLEAWQRGEAQLRWLPCPDCEYGRGIASAKPWRDS